MKFLTYEEGLATYRDSLRAAIIVIATWGGANGWSKAERPKQKVTQGRGRSCTAEEMFDVLVTGEQERLVVFRGK